MILMCKACNFVIKKSEFPAFCRGCRKRVRWERIDDGDLTQWTKTRN